MTAISIFLLSTLDLTHSTATSLITVVLGGALFFTAALQVLRQTIVALYATRVRDLEHGQTAASTFLRAPSSACSSRFLRWARRDRRHGAGDALS
jgi:hypothetical protein